MLILDTNHSCELGRGSAIGRRLQRRLDESSDRPVLTVITLEESMKSWLILDRRYRLQQPDKLKLNPEGTP
jgi:hypothetical protein